MKFIFSTGEKVTFFWMYNADSAFGHNVNHWHEGTAEESKKDAKLAWDQCNFKNLSIPFYEKAHDPNFEFDTSSDDVDLGVHYFACGLGYQEKFPDNKFHCNRGVKATIKVVSDLSECDMHHF